MFKSRERKIIFIDLAQRYPIREESIHIDSIHFMIQHHGIGWDFNTAETIIRSYDGYADGFAMGTLYKYLGYGGPHQMHHPGYLRLIRAATRTPMYVGDAMRAFFSEWTLKKVLQAQPQLFSQRKVLFQCATSFPILPEIIRAGGNIYAADPLFISGIPILLKGQRQIQNFLKFLKPIIGPVFFQWAQPLPPQKHSVQASQKLKKWMTQSDILVGFANILPLLEPEDAAHLSGKVILVDAIDSTTRKRLEKAGVSQIIQFLPKRTHLQMPTFKEFSVLEAVIDQTRLVENSTLSLKDYFLKWLERNRFSPKPPRVSKSFRRRCAFIIHALTQSDLWKAPGSQFLRSSPELLRNAIEKGASLLPCIYMGQLSGIVSQATGQVVDCDFYALPATPKQILAMNEEFLYKRLVQCVELAKSRGASIVGLGAYTKVYGDAGVTVAQRASIPVTNGNSYSAAATLWAAQHVVQKMGLVPAEKAGQKFQCKTVIIGATGSIGRVSSLLISLVVDHLVLVANRPDKLLELREELMELSPHTQVTLSTDSSPEIIDADLIIAATSNQTQIPILDMMKVKPGAVICDCSRPSDITRKQAQKRPDVLVIESGEVDLPGNPQMNFDMGLTPPSVYACTAETILLALEGRFESFSLSKQLSLEKTKEIYKIGVKHGAKLSAIQGPCGLVTDAKISECRALAIERLKNSAPNWRLCPSRKTRLLPNECKEFKLFQPIELHPGQ